MSEVVPADSEPVLESGSGFGRAVAVLVGLVAVTAALLATLQADSGRREDAASTRGSRLAASIFVWTAASGPHFTFRLSSLQDATALGLEATARQLATFAHPSLKAVEMPVALALTEASKRAARISEAMSELPSEADGVDRAARDAIGSSVAEAQQLVARQNASVEAAERYGGRGERAILGLSLAAIAAALLGLAAVVGGGRQGRLLLGVAVAAWLGAVGAGASALAI